MLAPLWKWRACGFASWPIWNNWPPSLLVWKPARLRVRQARRQPGQHPDKPPPRSRAKKKSDLRPPVAEASSAKVTRSNSVRFDAAESIAALPRRPASEAAGARSPENASPFVNETTVAAVEPGVAIADATAVNLTPAITLIANLTPDLSASPAPQAELSLEQVNSWWRQATSELDDITGVAGAAFERIAIIAPNRLAVYFSEAYNTQKEMCVRPERKLRLEQVLARVAGRPFQLEFHTGSSVGASSAKASPTTPAPATRQQRMQERRRHPFVREAMQMFDADITRLD